MEILIYGSSSSAMASRALAELASPAAQRGSKYPQVLATLPQSTLESYSAKATDSAQRSEPLKQCSYLPPFSFAIPLPVHPFPPTPSLLSP